MTQSIFEVQAELCRAMGHPIRLEIVHILREGPKRVGDITQKLALPQPTVSRHIAVLRSAGILSHQRTEEGLLYRITNPKIMEVCDLMREVLTEQYTQQSRLIDQL
ncbi:MAG: winged helix-turn-helix transcriptional regulator [Anaerolineales bacterium]|nr:winged helix-turn-helix transcriptional regulator [Anaerolineales bacterium]